MGRLASSPLRRFSELFDSHFWGQRCLSRHLTTATPAVSSCHPTIDDLVSPRIGVAFEKKVSLSSRMRAKTVSNQNDLEKIDPIWTAVFRLLLVLLDVLHFHLFFFDQANTVRADTDS